MLFALTYIFYCISTDMVKLDRQLFVHCCASEKYDLKAISFPLDFVFPLNNIHLCPTVNVE